MIVKLAENLIRVKRLRLNDFEPENRDSLGYYDYIAMEIVIRKELKPPSFWHTFYYEVTYAYGFLFDVYELRGDDPESERLVGSVANLLDIYIIGNRDLILKRWKDYDSLKKELEVKG